MNGRTGLVGVWSVLLLLGACGSGSPAKNGTPPDDTGGEGGGSSTGGSGGQAAPGADASLSPDVSSAEPDSGTTATGGTAGGAEAGAPPDLGGATPDTGAPAGEFPLAAVKA